MGSEFKAIILSAWKKNSLHFAWKLCPVYFHCCFICPVHFNAGGPYVQYISMVLSSLVLVMKDVVNAHPRLCVTRFSAHGVSSFDILLYLLLLLKKIKMP